MSTQAWSAAQSLASRDERPGFRPVLKSSSAELREHEIVTADGTLDSSWHRVLSVLADAPVVARVIGSEDRSSFHSDLVIFPGVGLVVTQRRLTRGQGADQQVVAAEDAVEVTLFEHHEIWPVLRRVIPDRDALRAPAAVDAVEDVITVSEHDRARVKAIVAARHGELLPTEEALSLMSDPDPRLRDMTRSTVGTSVLVMGRHPSGAAIAARQWSVTERGLYLSRTDDDTGDLVVAQVPPGHLAAEVQRVMDAMITFARTGEAQA